MSPQPSPVTGWDVAVGRGPPGVLQVQQVPRSLLAPDGFVHHRICLPSFPTCLQNAGHCCSHLQTRGRTDVSCGPVSVRLLPLGHALTRVDRLSVLLDSGSRAIYLHANFRAEGSNCFSFRCFAKAELTAAPPAAR